MDEINQKRNVIQLNALQSNLDLNGFSTLAMATRSGKSRVAVLRAIQIVDKNPNAKIFLAVPTQKLRDSNWKDEFIKWNAEYIFENNLTRSCYVSMQKEINQIFDLVILDEAHHITEANLDFFENNEIKSIIGLTATFPKTGIKKDMLNALAPVSFIYTLDQGVKDGIITPFEFHILTCELNKVDKTIKAGNIKRRWYQTEYVKYEYLQDKFNKAKEDLNIVSKIFKDWKNENWVDIKNQNPEIIKELEEKENALAPYKKRFETITFERARFIYDLKTKTDIARELIDVIHQDDLRYIVFCGSIAQANILCGDNTFHSNVKDHAFEKFKNQEINFLGVVNGLNEGITIENLDFAIAVQINSQELNLIQRMGRIICLRFGHIAKFYIIVCIDTKDLDWLEKAIASFDENVIFFHDAKEFIQNYKNNLN